MAATCDDIIMVITYTQDVSSHGVVSDVVSGGSGGYPSGSSTLPNNNQHHHHPHAALVGGHTPPSLTNTGTLPATPSHHGNCCGGAV